MPSLGGRALPGQLIHALRPQKGPFVEAGMNASVSQRGEGIHKMRTEENDTSDVICVKTSQKHHHNMRSQRDSETPTWQLLGFPGKQCGNAHRDSEQPSCAVFLGFAVRKWCCRC